MGRVCLMALADSLVAARIVSPNSLWESAI